MADGLGINTIAEGVETREQLEFLKLHKCHLVQGYYFNKPVCHDEIIRLLQAEQGNTRSTGTGTAG
jgi:EAL domain-containing protein (putative c-di-GMP-specific phosphodiesterase class I)